MTTPITAAGDQQDNHGPVENKAAESSDTRISHDTAKGEKDPTDTPASAPARTWRFKAVLVALCVTALLSALEATIVSTALPTIAADLDMAEDYIWVVNAFLLTSTAFLPLGGQLADIWGRRWLTIGATAIFLLGSGVSGGATSGNMLIAGRAVQGLGGGGINLLIDLIIVDLVPLRERPKFMALVFGVFAVGTGLGPVIGGLLVQRTTWRWTFYINLPVGGAALVLLVLFLQVGYKKKPLREALAAVDFVGNGLIICSTVAILLALTYGGTLRPWSSWRVILPLVLGLVGMVSAHAYMASPWCKQPTIPPRLFANRTSAVGLFLTFVQALLFVWVIYFLPVYFQSVLLSSPTASGVHLLPTVLVLIPFAAVGGGLLSKTGRYRPIIFAGYLLIALGIGLFTMLSPHPSRGLWAGLQIINAAGSGIVLPALLPAIQAGLEDKDDAASTATFAYMRSYGAVWGASIPAVIFNNQVGSRLLHVSDPLIRSRLTGSGAYASANAAFVRSLPLASQEIVRSIYSHSLRTGWIVGAALAGASTLFVLLMKEVALRTEQDTEFGLKDRTKPVKDGADETDKIPG